MHIYVYLCTPVVGVSLREAFLTVKSRRTFIYILPDNIEVCSFVQMVYKLLSRSFKKQFCFSCRFKDFFVDRPHSVSLSITHKPPFTCTHFCAKRMLKQGWTSGQIEPSIIWRWCREEFESFGHALCDRPWWKESANSSLTIRPPCKPQTLNKASLFWSKRSHAGAMKGARRTWTYDLVTSAGRASMRNAKDGRRSRVRRAKTQAWHVNFLALRSLMVTVPCASSMWKHNRRDRSRCSHRLKPMRRLNWTCQAQGKRRHGERMCIHTRSQLLSLLCEIWKSKRQKKKKTKDNNNNIIINIIIIDNNNNNSFWNGKVC